MKKIEIECDETELTVIHNYLKNAVKYQNHTKKHSPVNTAECRFFQYQSASKVDDQSLTR